MRISQRGQTPGNKSLSERKSITIYFEGKAIPAFEGDTVGSALYAAGRRVFGRSFKFHRPRGLYCMSGRCPNCLMTIDGEPNVRACITPVQQGMRVESQNAWPSLDHDVLAAADKMDSQLEAGFYYKKFINPPLDWMKARSAIRKVAGLAPVPVGKMPRRHDKLSLHAEVAVIGGGPAGMAAAIEAGRSGKRVLLIDDNPDLGGRLKFTCFTDLDAKKTGPEIAAEMQKQIESMPNITVLTSALVFGLYEDNLLGIEQGNLLIKARASQVIIATGCHEKQEVFENNDRPGVMMGRAALLLANFYGILPGKRIVVSTAQDRGWLVVYELFEAGANIVGIVDRRPSAGKTAEKAVTAAQSKGIPLFWSSKVRKARGHPAVSSAIIQSIATGQDQQVICDTIVTCSGYQGFNGLLFQSGAKMTRDEKLWDFTPSELPENVYAAGEVLGAHSFEYSVLTGQAAARQALAKIETDRATPERTIDDSGFHKVFTDDSDPALKKILAIEDSERKEAYQDFDCSLDDEPTKRFVCICEDITVKNITQSIAEGYDNIETLKRYSTISMGPCQGKMCSLTGLNLCAKATGKTPGETGTTTSRPPVRPITMGTLSGRRYHGHRHTPLHHIHKKLGAKFLDAGQWKRPETYGNIEAEYRAVREGVGIIDVSTLGKLIIEGPDSVKLLNYVYTGDFSSLPAGKTRYGLICTDAGVILDDGTVGRLSEDRFFITTTTGNADVVDQWIGWIISCAQDWKVRSTNHTSGLAAINLAGPKSRDCLQPLTDIDLSAGAFPYLRIAEGKVAGIPATVLRIGFVGELSYEIHVSAEYGVSLWEALMQAGEPFGITPFGVEAQRILRLEKKHLLPGTDTDALSSPIEAGCEWAVKMEKDDFVGKPAIAAVLNEGVTSRLVGFELEDASLLAEEGAQVIVGGKPAGRITSSRLSPGLGKSIGLAWVPVEKAVEDTPIEIQYGENGRITGRVRMKPFYDPSGEKLKS